MECMASPQRNQSPHSNPFPGQGLETRVEAEHKRSTVIQADMDVFKAQKEDMGGSHTGSSSAVDVEGQLLDLEARRQP